MARFFRFALAATMTVVVGLFVTLVSYVLGLWAGGHRFELARCLLLGVPLPIFVGLLAAPWPVRKLNWNALSASIAGAAFGLTYGYLAVRAGYWITFHAWGAFGHSVFLKIWWGMDIEMIVCSTVASACAMLLTTTPKTQNVLLAVALLLIGGILIPGSIFNLITRNQELTVAVVTSDSHGPHVPEVEENGPVQAIDPGAVSSRVMQLLRNAGINGNYQVAQLYRQGRGRQVLAIIVISGLVTKEADLPEPRGTDVIYLQGPGGWKRIPSQVPTLDRKIYIYRDPDARSCHQVAFTDASGVGRIVFVGDATQCGPP